MLAPHLEHSDDDEPSNTRLSGAHKVVAGVQTPPSPWTPSVGTPSEPTPMERTMDSQYEDFADNLQERQTKEEFDVSLQRLLSRCLSITADASKNLSALPLDLVKVSKSAQTPPTPSTVTVSNGETPRTPSLIEVRNERTARMAKAEILEQTLETIFALVNDEYAGIEEILQAEALWSVVDEIEADLDCEEILIDTELEMQEEMMFIDNILQQEREHLIQEMIVESEYVAHIRQVRQIDEEEYKWESQSKAHDDDELLSLLPLLSDSVMRRRYAKYRTLTQRATVSTFEGKLVQDSNPANKVTLTSPRVMSREDFFRQLEALQCGAPKPLAVRDNPYLASQALFPGDINPPISSKVEDSNAGTETTLEIRREAENPSPNDLQNGTRDIVRKKGGDSVGSSVARRIRSDNQQLTATKMREAVPPIPNAWPVTLKPPTREELSKASWANPGPPKPPQVADRRAEFVQKYSPCLRSDLPPPPSRPAAPRACPLPGTTFPSHKLKLKGLPMRCSGEDIRQFLGEEHCSHLLTWEGDGFDDGIKILRNSDGWLTGEAIIKFDGRAEAMYAMLSIDRKMMGRRMIYADCMIVPTPPNRGRIKIIGLHKKTTVRDILRYLQGWNTIADEPESFPEMLKDSTGRLTGEAVIAFHTEQEASNFINCFDLRRPLHDRVLKAEQLPPLIWMELREEWEVMRDLEDE